MLLRPALFAVPIAAAIACWFVVRAQQPAPAGADRTPIDPTQLAAIATEIAQRSEHLKPMIEEVHTADWLAKGAPEAYIGQWRSLAEQNQAIQADMTGIAQHPDAMQEASLEQIMRALFRLHRFDSDLDALLNSVRRYQNPALADLIESVAAGDQKSIEKLQQYVLDLANEKERELDVENNEAQRCRSTLAGQPPVRPSAQGKTTASPNNSTSGTPK